MVIFLEESFEGGAVRPSKGFQELPRAEPKPRGPTEVIDTEMKVVVIFLEEFLEGGPVRTSEGFPELPRAAREPARC